MNYLLGARLTPGLFYFQFGSWEGALIASGMNPKDNLPGLTLKMPRKMSADEIEQYKKKPGPVKMPGSCFQLGL